MNVNRIQRPSQIEQAPGSRRPGGEARRHTTPAEVLAILGTSAGRPRPLRINGLWKTGPALEGARS